MKWSAEYIRASLAPEILETLLQEVKLDTCGIGGVGGGYTFLANVSDAVQLKFERMIAPNAILLLLTLTRLPSMGLPTRTVTLKNGQPLNPKANKVSRFVMGPSATVGALSVEVVTESGVTSLWRGAPCSVCYEDEEEVEQSY